VVLLWPVTGPATMSTQPQNPHLIGFVAYSGPSHTTQPYKYWLLLDGEADPATAEGPVKKATSVVWCLLVHCWEECYEMNVGYQSLWAGGLASSGNGWDLGVAFRRDTCMSSSSLHWEEFKYAPGSLHYFALSFVLILTEICLVSSGMGIPREGKHFSVLGSPDCSLWGRAKHVPGEFA
uniref:Small integral membrane protein 12 n=1 Tax=Aotus nancymaae TaxID=37293 RepID=A0A2K5CBG8_AOTNA